MLPPLSGRPIRVEIRRSLGPHLAATHIPRRVILLDAGLLAQPGEFERILVHEIFHFAWVRLSNQTRRSWEDVLAAEFAARARGELGWSSEWRKDKLKRSDDPGANTGLAPLRLRKLLRYLRVAMVGIAPA